MGYKSTDPAAISKAGISIPMRPVMASTVYAQRTLMLSPWKGNQYGHSHGTQGKRTTPAPT